ncbi:MAG: TrmB family transcriptional regulator [Candidatus Woesearchaeota archaeon]
MIITEELLNRLKDFGLNSYEVKLWVALLSRGVSTAGELSDIANVPRSRTYDVLESLEKKGFIIMKIGKPIKYLAIEPDRIIEIIQKNIQKEAKVKAELVENLKDSEMLKELKLLHTNGIEHIDSSDLSGAVKGRTNVYSHMESTISQAEESVTILTTTTGFIQKVELLLPTFEKLHRRGVDIKIAAPLTDECAKLVEDVSPYAQVRHTDKPARFILVDKKELLFMLMDDSTIHPTYDVGIWINSPFFTQAIENLFELAWNEMKEQLHKKS